MNRSHEPGCDANHTDRQRCNGVEVLAADGMAQREGRLGQVGPPALPAPITAAKLNAATLLEFLPLIAVAAMIGWGLLTYLISPESINLSPAIGLLFLIVFFGSGAGWFLAGVPIGGCAALVLRLCASIGVVAAFVQWFDLGTCDDSYELECESASGAPLLFALALWMLLTPLSAALLFVTQRHRVTRVGAT